MTVPAVVVAAPASGKRKDHRRNGLDRGVAAGGPCRRCVQGRPGLHRPGLPRAGGRARRSQLGSGSGGGEVDWPAIRARCLRRRHRRDRRGDGTFRRTYRVRRTHSGVGLDRPCRGSARGPQSSWWSMPAARARASLHCYMAFRHSTPRPAIAGVVLNRVGSARHEQVLRQACEQAGVPVLGAIPRDDELEVPSRYLGLVTAVEYDRRARHAVEAMTALIARHVDVGALFAFARSRSSIQRGTRRQSWANPSASRITVALAGGKAFSFGYPEHTELVRACGADVKEFDPLVDPLPDGSDAVLLPGGFPEQFAAELSGNEIARRQINALAAAGAPIHAECAGLLYLVSELDGHPMCGVLSRIGTIHRAAHSGLSRRRRNGRFAAVPRRSAGRRTRIPPHRSHIHRHLPAGVDISGQDVDPVRDGAVHARSACFVSAHASGCDPRGGGAASWPTRAQV